MTHKGPIANTEVATPGDGLDYPRDMAELARAVAALRIIGDDLVPAEVTQVLGSEPTTGWTKGDTRTFGGVTRTVSFGKWTLQAVETSPADLDVQVAEILSRLTADESVWAELRTKYDVNLFCGWFMKHGNEGVSVAPETMSALGVRGILLDVDLYCGDGEKVPD